MPSGDLSAWQGLALYLAIILSPVLVVAIWEGARELLDRAYLRGFDTAWNQAVQATELGHRLT